MMDFFTWLQDTPLAIWVAEAETIWAYPTILTLHTVGLSVLVGANAVIDFRLLGYSPGTPLPALKKLFGPMWFALAINAITGVLLFISAARVTGVLITYYAKLTFIALALMTLMRIRRIVFDSDAAPQAAMPRGARWLAVLSLFLWLAATTAGRMNAYVHWTF